MEDRDRLYVAMVTARRAADKLKKVQAKMPPPGEYELDDIIDDLAVATESVRLVKKGTD